MVFLQVNVTAKISLDFWIDIGPFVCVVCSIVHTNRLYVDLGAGAEATNLFDQIHSSKAIFL